MAEIPERKKAPRIPAHDADAGAQRRRLLKRGAVLGGAALLAAGRLPTAAAEPRPKPANDAMRRPGRPFSNYGVPAEQEGHVIRWIAANPMAAGNGVSWTPLHDLAGTITPNALHFERHHNGVPQIDPREHRLLVHGMVKRSLRFNMADLLRYPMVSRLCFIECGGNSSAGWNSRPLQSRVGHMHGLLSCSEWTGVPLALLLREARVDPRARWLVAEGGDAAGVSVSLPLSKAQDDVILALYQNGERVRPENGYPLRLLVPGWEGIVNVKWLRRLELVREPLMSRYETARYTDLLADGSARQFSFQMQAKSVITFPSPGFVLPAAGLYQVSGLAWSGAGRVKQVEVSSDGGETWDKARLQGPLLPASLTRFSLNWRWTGEPAVLLSRVTDDTGYRQPTREALLAQRGEHGYYHYNAMVSWQVQPDGQVRHVYV